VPNTREYVSLFALAKKRRKHFRVVKSKLEFDGVEPAFDPKKIGASFYRRKDLWNAMARLWHRGTSGKAAPPPFGIPAMC
jgi:hypothetical protein